MTRPNAASKIWTGLTLFALFSTARAAEIPVSSTAPAAGEDLTRARASLDKGLWRDARVKSLSFLEKFPKSPEGWTVLGETYLASEQFGYALRRFSKALKFDPRYSPAFYGRGQAYEKLNKTDEAANEYQAALRADPDSTPARNAWDRLKSQASLPEP